MDLRYNLLALAACQQQHSQHHSHAQQEKSQVLSGHKMKPRTAGTGKKDKASAAPAPPPKLSTPNPGSMRTEEALLRARAATVDVYVELDQPDEQAAVSHVVGMKTVHYGLTHYNAVAPTRGHARRRQLQQIDREVFRTREGQVGPMEQRLNSFPPVLGIATGGFREQSKSLDNLLKNFAGMGAETWMGKLSAPTTMQARKTLLGLMRKELGVIVARGHARLILARARSLHTQTARAAA
ncbi:hypothetical protein T492DRAFT_870216, partial [Pavlovales sp. CCMP2436]